MPLLSKRPLVVVPNPYHQLDHEGRPACAARFDPSLSGGARLWIGATIQTKVLASELRPGVKTAPGQNPEPELFVTDQETWFEFTTDPVSIPDSMEHRARVREGSVLAADASTAKRCGLTFVEPKAALAAESAKAFAVWKREHDEASPFAPEAVTLTAAKATKPSKES